MTEQELVAEALRLWKEDLANPEPPKTRGHGTPYSYRHNKCRCQKCRDANSTQVRRLREVRVSLVARGYSAFTHGRSAYSNWGCRCEVCKADTAPFDKIRYERRRDRLASEKKTG